MFKNDQIDISHLSLDHNAMRNSIFKNYQDGIWETIGEIIMTKIYDWNTFLEMNKKIIFK